MELSIVRVLRTMSSERFLLQSKQGEDAAAVDLHYLRDGNVAGTVILFEGGRVTDKMVPDLLQYVDEILLPDVSLNDRSLSFTVVRGRVIGDFSSEKDAGSDATRKL